MGSKAFIGLLVAVIILGGSLGGAFAAGVAVGKGQEEDTAQNSPQPQPTPGLQSQGPGQLSPEQLEQFRQQFRDAGGRGGITDRGGLTGTIEKIEGDTITINTPQGPLVATIRPETRIQRIAEGAPEDLQSSLQVMVTGQRGEDGIVEAVAVTILPEGAEGFLGAGTSFGGRR